MILPTKNFKVSGDQIGGEKNCLDLYRTEGKENVPQNNSRFAWAKSQKGHFLSAGGQERNQVTVSRICVKEGGGTLFGFDAICKFF